MKVILNQDVKGQGKKGDLIEVSDGYARNFLLPKNLAKPATKENINDVNSILGNINGISDEITIRIYDSTDNQINAIKDKYDVINIRTF